MVDHQRLGREDHLAAGAYGLEAVHDGPSEENTFNITRVHR